MREKDGFSEGIKVSESKELEDHSSADSSDFAESSHSNIGAIQARERGITMKEIAAEKSRLMAEKQKLLDTLHLYEMDVWNTTTQELQKVIHNLYNDLPENTQKRVSEISRGVETGPKNYESMADNGNVYRYYLHLSRIIENPAHVYMKPWEQYNPFSKISKFFAEAQKQANEYFALASTNVQRAKSICNERVKIIDEATRLLDIRGRQLGEN